MKFILAFVLLNVVANVKCARILAWATLGTRSHQNVFLPLLGELVNKGHDITFVTNYECKLPIQQVVLHEMNVECQKILNYFEDRQQGNWAQRLELVKGAGNYSSRAIEIIYESSAIQQTLKDKYDLILINMAMAHLFVPLIYKSQPSTPRILISPNNLVFGYANTFGDLERSDHVPFLMSGLTDRMSFMERVVNTITYEAVDMFFRLLLLPSSQAKIRDYLGEFPPVTDMLKNTSLAFINTHASTNYLRTLPPGVIEVGAIHCRGAKPLPQELENFITGFREGFIVFAVGSAIPMEQMSGALLDLLTNTFARLPVGVIWQWKAKSQPNVSSNVKLVEWLPQQDLLGHSKVRGLLTHGGLMSIQEAVYHGVPVLGMPLGTDQDMNVNRAVQEGFGVRIDWKGLTEEILYNAITELLSDSKYTENILRLSSLLRDQPESPLERAVFWTEFTIRHGETQYFRSAARDLAPWQQALLDVYAFILVVIISITLFSVCLLRRMCRRCFRKGNDTCKKKAD